MLTTKTEARAVSDLIANPRLLASFRVAVGVIAVTKGFLLVAYGASPVLVALWFGLALCVATGWRARWAALTMLGLGVYLVWEYYNNHFYLLWLLLLLVAISDCERHYALRSRGIGPVPGWPVSLMRWQLSLVYVFAGLGKVNGDFLRGRVLEYFFDHSIFPIPDLGRAVASLSLFVVLLELLLGTLVWFRRARSLAFALAGPLHLGMLMVSTSTTQAVEIAIFGLLMAVLFAAYIDVNERSRLVVWDDTCTFCRHWASAFRRLDAFGALRFVAASSGQAYDGTGVTPAAAARAMQLVHPDGTLDEGFDAVRGIVAVLPLGYLVAPWLGLPGVRHAGRRAYARVAARRTCGLKSEAAWV